MSAIRIFAVTDSARITEVLRAHAPRTPKEMIEDRYGLDVTMDANGRAHAPCDGWTDPETDVAFRGGEYLPDPDTEEFRYRSPSRYLSWQQAGLEVQGVYCSRAQYRACLEECIAQNNALRAARSNYVGTPGERMPLTVRVVHVSKSEGAYGLQFWHTLEDASGNAVAYRGSRQIADPGETITALAAVKAHYESRAGVKTTRIERPTKISVSATA